ncbi:MAG: hypothetical protein A2030_04620 [Chloroflexi bacterium RBG_19FT_COMBO_50_10]|nr:MAG: hypothetical protein A2030_04620 [Chloroflexi bacterium RBG_19FT_COMBO_50_10]
MNIRPFGWRDLPLLLSYRDRGLFLDSTRVLIHGSALIPMGSLLTFLGPTIRNYTYRCENSLPSGLPLIGQVTYAMGASYARLSFLAPENAIERSDLSALSEYMAAQMGRQGAFHILADVDESSPVYHLLRLAGFAIYARQRIWRLDGQPIGEEEAVSWGACKPSDVIGTRSLYCNVVPGLVQQVEPLPKKNLKGFVHYQNGDIRAYIELKYGRNGIWVQPYVHPDAENFDRQLVYLLRNLPGRGDRPLYICVRSYQSWLETAIDALGAQPGSEQAVMVRHLTIALRVKQSYPLPAMNGTHAEPTAPIAQIQNSRLLELSEVEKHPSTDSIS